MYSHLQFWTEAENEGLSGAIETVTDFKWLWSESSKQLQKISQKIVKIFDELRNIHNLHIQISKTIM